MELVFNKMQARIALEILDEVKEELDEKPLTECFNSYIEVNKVNELYQAVIHRLGDVYKVDIYPYTEVVEKAQVDTDNIYINGQVFSREDIDNMLDGDIQNITEFLKNLDLSDVFDYIRNLLKLDSEEPLEFFNRELDEVNCKLILTSHNLVNKTGICRAMLKDMRVKFSIGLTVNPSNGEQEIACRSIDLVYEHSHGGRNGYTIGRVKYDPHIEVWYGYNFEKEKYEVI